MRFFVGSSECRYQSFCIIIFDVLLGFRALENFYKLLVSRIILILSAGSDNVDVWAGVIFRSDGCLWIQLSGYSIAAVDYGSIAVIQCTWELWGFQFYNLDILRIGSDICSGSLGRVGPVLQGDQPLLGQKKQRTSFIGWVIWNRNGCTVWQFRKRLVLLGIYAEWSQVGIADGYQVGAILLIECIEEWTVLERVDINVALSQCLVWCYIIAKGYDLDVEALFFRLLGYEFYYIFTVTGGSTYGNGVRFAGSGACSIVASATIKEKGSADCCGGNNQSFLQIHNGTPQCISIGIIL